MTDFDFNLQFVYIFSGYGVPRSEDEWQIKLLQNNKFSAYNKLSGENLEDTPEGLLYKELLWLSSAQNTCDSYTKLLYKLASQALRELRMYMSDFELAKTLVYRKKDLACEIYGQIRTRIQ